MILSVHSEFFFGDIFRPTGSLGDPRRRVEPTAASRRPSSQTKVKTIRLFYRSRPIKDRTDRGSGRVLKNAGTVPAFNSERNAQFEPLNACRRTGFWPCPQLAHMLLMWVRLRRSTPGRSRCGMRWFLSRKVGGLITATCGLGGPHYGEEQTAKQPYARAGPLFPPPPLAPPAKAPGAKGGQAVVGAGVWCET